MDTQEFLSIMQQANDNGRSVDPLALSKALSVEKKAYDKKAYLGLDGVGSYDATKTRDGQPMEQQQYQSGTDGYTVTPQGPVRNNNKIFNNFNGQEMQGIESNMHNSRVYRDKVTGQRYQLGNNGEKVPFNGKTGYVYAGPAQEEGVRKVGFSKYGVVPRYSPGVVSGYKGKQNGWESGPAGIDPNNADMNWELPIDMAATFEKLRQGNSYVNEARVSHDDGSEAAKIARAKYLGGTSEYTYENQSPLSNQDVGNGVAGNANGMSAKEFMAAMKSGGGDPNPYKSNKDRLASVADQIINGTMDQGDGRLLTDALLVGAGGANILQNGMDLVAEGAAYAGEKSGLMGKEYADKVRSFHDSSLEGWYKKLGVNQKYSQDATRELTSKIENEDYFGALGSILSNFDVHMAQSAPEMIGLAGKTLGLAATVNSSTKDELAKFEKKEGREATKAEIAMMVASRMAVLVPEQMLLVGPLKTIFKAARKGSAGVKGGFSDVGMTVGKKTKNVAKTIGFETVQEMADTTQNQYWEKGGSGDTKGLDAFSEAYDRVMSGKVVSKTELIASGMAGGVMGGVLRGGAELSGAREAVSNSINIHNFKKSLKDMDTYLDEADKEFAQLSLDDDIVNAKAERATIREARVQLREAFRSKEPTIDVLSKSENSYIKSYAESLKATFVNNKAAEFEYKDDKSVATVIRQDVMFNKEKMLKSLGKTEEEWSQMNGPDKKQFIENSLTDKKKRESLVKSLSTDAKVALFNKIATNKDKKALEKDYGSGVDNILNTKERSTNSTINNADLIKKKIGKTKAIERTDDKVDVDTKKIDAQITWGNVIPTLLGGGSRSKSNVRAKLNKYSNKSLRAAIDTASPEMEAVINEVLEKRSKAVGRAGIAKQDVSGDGYTYVESGQELGDSKQSTMGLLKVVLGRTEMRDMDEIKSTEDIIKQALDKGHINKKQRDVFMKRLKKIDAKTKDNMIQEELDSSEVKESEAAAVKKKYNDSENTTDDTESTDNREYRFEDYKGNKLVGKITFEDKNKGMFVVEFTNSDGEKESAVFGYKRGNQIKEIGKKTNYRKGKIVEVGSKKEDTAEDTKPEVYEKPTPEKVDENTVKYGNYIIVKNDSNGFDVMLDGKKVTGSNRGGIDKAYSMADKHAEKEINNNNKKSEGGMPEPEFKGESENKGETSENQAEASQKANMDILGEFDVENLTDEELKEMSVILNQLFDC